MPPQAEHLGGTRQDHGQHWGGGQKQMPMAGRMRGAPKVRQVALGISTQEPRSGCQQKGEKGTGEPNVLDEAPRSWV